MKNKLPFKTIHRMMKENSDEYKIGYDAVTQLDYFLESVITNVAVMSKDYAEHCGRKTINSDDVNHAIEILFLTHTLDEIGFI